MSDFLWRLRELRAFTFHPKADVHRRFLEICRRTQVDPEATMTDLMEEYVEMHSAAEGEFGKRWNTASKPLSPTDGRRWKRKI